MPKVGIKAAERPHPGTLVGFECVEHFAISRGLIFQFSSPESSLGGLRVPSVLVAHAKLDSLPMVLLAFAFARVKPRPEIQVAILIEPFPLPHFFNRKNFVPCPISNCTT